MKRKRNELCVVRTGDWWTVRYRERVSDNGVLGTVNRAVRLAEVGPNCKTKVSARELAKETSSQSSNSVRASNVHAT